MTSNPQTPSLTWGVKQSFCNYVQSAGGVIETLGGTERAEDGTFVFPMAPDSDLSLDADGKPQGQAKFLGQVHFTAHGGMLNVYLSDPILEISDTSARITVDDHKTKPRRIEIAKLDLATITTDETGALVIPTALSLEGIQFLGDHYPLRAALDPVRLRLATA